MWRLTKKCLEWFEVDLQSESKNSEFSRTLRELVAILFAVVFGVGLSEIGNVRGTYDTIVLVLAYAAVMLSWWGYHWGTIKGPRETNGLCYFIDCLLVALYWFLINWRDPLSLVLGLYAVMFLLYALWEFVRFAKHETPQLRSALSKNGRLFLVFVALCLLAWFAQVQTCWSRYIVIAALFALFPLYRVLIHRAYSMEKHEEFSQSALSSDDEHILVQKARTVAPNAKAPLSDFKVGAAILSDTGNIYVGCNVEFMNYSNTIHAEEAAISAFVAAGETRAIAIAVFTSGNKVSFPCGMCRQSLFELGGNNLEVIACTDSVTEKMTMGELLPKGFHL